MAQMEALLKIKADVTGQTAVDKLGNSLRTVGTRGTTAMNNIRSATAGAMGVMRTFLPMLGAVGLVKFAKDGIDSADAMSKLSQRTGIAAPMLDKFRKVAELSDTSIETLGRAFPALASNIQKASQGTGPAADAFSQLGISLTDASGKLRSTDEVMLDVADRFAQMEDGTQKAALASDIFGRRLGSELIPMLNSGGDAVRDMSTALTQDFADDSAVFNDRLESISERIQTLGLVILERLLPYIDKFVAGLEALVVAFNDLPEPVQSVVIVVGSLAVAFGLLAPIITPLIGLLKGLLALKIGATIAGWAGAVVPWIGKLTALGKVLVAVFTGPVGWVALAIAAGVAIYAFRDQIADAFKTIGDVLKGAAKFFYDAYVKPVITAGDVVIKGLKAAFSKLSDILTSPFKKAVDAVKGVFRGLLQFIARGINDAIGKINGLIRLGQKVGINIQTVPTVSVPAFAAGGVVNRPTLAMVGEAGPEYIIPEGKMAAAAANYLSGARGDAVIPAFANGGFVGGPGAFALAPHGGAANTTVQITTGPVLQQDGQRYVTVKDLERALKQFGDQIFRNSRSYGGRRYQGAY